MALAFESAARLTTAYAMVLPAPQSQPDVRHYYSEPDQAPFFANTQDGTDAKELPYYALSIAQLPDAVGAPGTYFPFPLLPYAAFVPPADQTQFGFDHQYVESFEYQLINPTRKAAIEKMALGKALQSHTGQDTGDVTAITPEGYAAAFVHGNWHTLTVAQMGPQKGDKKYSDKSRPISTSRLRVRAETGQFRRRCKKRC